MSADLYSTTVAISGSRTSSGENSVVLGKTQSCWCMPVSIVYWVDAGLRVVVSKRNKRSRRWSRKENKPLELLVLNVSDDEQPPTSHPGHFLPREAVMEPTAAASSTSELPPTGVATGEIKVKSKRRLVLRTANLAAWERVGPLGKLETTSIELILLILHHLIR